MKLATEVGVIILDNRAVGVGFQIQHLPPVPQHDMQRYITQAEHRQYLLSRRRTLLTSSCFHYNYTLTYLQAFDMYVESLQIRKGVVIMEAFDIHVVAVIVAITKEAGLFFQAIASISLIICPTVAVEIRIFLMLSYFL